MPSDSIRAILNWSGGKDSCFALSRCGQERIEICGLLTTLHQDMDLGSSKSSGSRVSHHEVSEELITAQARSLGLPLKTVILPANPSDKIYGVTMEQSLQAFSAEGISDAVFGDIFLEDLRSYREQRLNSIGWKAHFPLWKRDTKTLARDFIAAGFRAIVVSVDLSRLDAGFCGRMFDTQFLDDLPDEVDPCGEYGEFHTFVYDGPLFRRPVEFTTAGFREMSYALGQSQHRFVYCELAA